MRRRTSRRWIRRSDRLQFSRPTTRSTNSFLRSSNTTFSPTLALSMPWLWIHSRSLNITQRLIESNLFLGDNQHTLGEIVCGKGISKNKVALQNQHIEFLNLVIRHAKRKFVLQLIAQSTKFPFVWLRLRRSRASPLSSMPSFSNVPPSKKSSLLPLGRSTTFSQVEIQVEFLSPKR